MPADNEIYFGLYLSEAGDFLKSIGCPFTPQQVFTAMAGDEEFEDEPTSDDIQEIFDRIDLRPAYEKAVIRAGWKIEEQPDPFGYGYTQIHVISEYGDRRTGYFTLTTNIDTCEIGTTFEDAFIGVSVTSRYVPKFLDMSNEHGTLHGIKRDAKYKERMQIAKEEIIAALPGLKDGDYETVMIFY